MPPYLAPHVMVMYTAGNGAVCKSIYYCLIVSLSNIVEFDLWTAINP